jgi:hypothetical protein
MSCRMLPLSGSCSCGLDMRSVVVGATASTADWTLLVRLTQVAEQLVVRTPTQPYKCAPPLKHQRPSDAAGQQPLDGRIQVAVYFLQRLPCLGRIKAHTLCITRRAYMLE